MKRGRGRPAIPFDFSPYWAKRSIREQEERLDEWRRQNGELHAGTPAGLRVESRFPTETSLGRKITKPLVIPYGRIVLEIDVLRDNAQSEGRRLSEKAATLIALQNILARFGRQNHAEHLLDTALRQIRQYRRDRPHEFPPKASGE